jgi:hypothetical protein
LDSLAVPIVAGLVAGVGLVLLFAAASLSHFNSIEQNGFPSSREGYSLTLEGLKDYYSIGEKLNFTLRMKGYGNDCGTPNVLIMDQNGRTVYTLFNHGAFSCPGGMFLVDRTWTLQELDAPENLVLSEAGTYKVKGSFHGSETTKNITIT